MKLLGKNNDLRTEDGQITKAGYLVMAASTAFGLLVFLAGRSALIRRNGTPPQEEQAPRGDTTRKLRRYGKKLAKLIVN